MQAVGYVSIGSVATYFAMKHNPDTQLEEIHRILRVCRDSDHLHRTMVLAAMDTTANSLARLLQILSERQDVQDKLRRELLEALGSEDDDTEIMDLDKLMGLPYLEAVMSEVLRWGVPVPLGE